MNKERNEITVDNLQEVIHRASNDHPTLTIGFADDKGSIQEQTYRNLLETAGRILYRYQQLGIKQGDYLIIASSNNYSIINHLWAAFLGGIIPTVLQPPVSFNEHNPASEKLINVYELLDNPYVIISENFHDSDGGKIDETKVILDTFPEASTQQGKFVNSNPEEIAFIQFSSGSTGAPKGVMLSHKNLITNVHSISVALEFTHDYVMANWMPLYHDMGLIGYHLSSIYLTQNQIHIETTDFIKNPFLWLQILSEKRVNITGCPNFGQALLNRHFLRKDPGELDLSSVRAILNGAEPISADIMEQMVSNLEKYDFKKEAMMPVYGMAEATLAISFTPLGTPPVITTFNQHCLVKNNVAKIHNGNNVETQRIVGVGKPLLGIEICVCNQSGDKLKDGEVGEVCIKGDNVFSGYLKDFKENKTQNKRTWFRTGDQGFILWGDLYITGRFKDIIFINSMNFYSNDLEAIAIRECGLVFGKFIVGGYFDPEKGQDRIIAFLTGSDNPGTRDKFKAVANLYKNSLGIQISNFVVIKSNQIHKTSSGKLQRYKMIQDFLNGHFKEIQL